MSKKRMRLTKDPIPSLIKKIAIPASVGMFFNTMYNVTDTYFAGLLSTEAIAALSLSFPIFFIIMAVGIGMSQGINSLIANALGENNKAKAKRYAKQSFTFAIFISIGLTIIGLVVSPFLFQLLGAQGSYLNTSLEYMNIILLGTVFWLLTFVVNGVLSAQGDTKTYRNALIAGAILNVALNPLFMFTFNLGVAGIALATTLIVFLELVYLIFVAIKTPVFNFKKPHEFKLKKKTVKEMLEQGIPATANMGMVALGIFIITYFISDFGQSAVAAYGVSTRIEQIFLLPTIGLNMAALSLVGQNNGARKMGRVMESYKTLIKYGVYLMIVFGVVLYFTRTFLLGIFTEDQDVVLIGSQYLQIASFILFVYPILFVSTSTMLGLKKPIVSVWINVYRQIIGAAIIFWLLAYVFGLGVYGIWIGVAITTVSSAAFSVWYVLNLIKKS
ncbi:MAG: MATE family efflux transporter [bacterium]